MTFAILAFVVAAINLYAACPDMPTFTPGHNGVDGTDPIVGFIRDLNADGKEDLVVFYVSSPGFQVFLGSASGVLTPTPLQFSSGFFSDGGHAAGDLNGDGKVDIVSGTISGNGNGTFTAPVTVGLNPRNSWTT